MVAPKPEEIRVTIRIVVAENHSTTRVGIRKLFEAEQEVELVGEAETVGGALELVKELNPDVLVTDLTLGEKGNGRELCERAKSLAHPPNLVFHTAHNSTEELLSCRLFEADGYVHKSEKPEKLIEAIRAACRGEQRWYIGQEPEEINVRLQEVLKNTFLTFREREVFELLRSRRTDAEIARELSISTSTVNTHVTNLLRKLGLSNRLEIS